MSQKAKTYVVWTGKNPGIYPTWEACKEQVSGVAGAKFQSFNNYTEAQHAYKVGPQASQKAEKSHQLNLWKTLPKTSQPIPNSLVVDAACSGNPGAMEYRGVSLETKDIIFSNQGLFGTNNIGEFLAIVHALALPILSEFTAIYSDSAVAIGWVQKKQAKTLLPRTPESEPTWQLLDHAIQWLNTHTPSLPIYHWKTQEWGEIPEDYGRK